jgi:hypothetical protein
VRGSEVRWPRPAPAVVSPAFVRLAVVSPAFVSLVVVGALGCTAYATYKPMPTGCTVTDAATSVTAAYEFQSIDTFEGESSSSPPFYPSGDMTPGAAVTLTLGTPPDGAPCGSATALEVQSSGFTDWGSLIGYNNFGSKDGSAFEGISFWSHPATNSNKALTLQLDDPNTYNSNTAVSDGGLVLPTPPTADCTKYPTPDGGASSTGFSTDPATGMVLSSGSASAPLPPNGCGNDYQAVILLESGWQLVTIPFGTYQQLHTPNQVPNDELTVTGNAPGTRLITSRLLLFTIRFPKELGTDLWIDNLAFYRHKGWRPAGSDGGADAP